MDANKTKTSIICNSIIHILYCLIISVTLIALSAVIATSSDESDLHSDLPDLCGGDEKIFEVKSDYCAVLYGEKNCNLGDGMMEIFKK